MGIPPDIIPEIFSFEKTLFFCFLLDVTMQIVYNLIIG